MKKFKQFIKESSGYTRDAEDAGMYDDMGTLLQKVEVMLGEMPSYPEEAVEMLDDVDSAEAEELSIAIQTLIDETDSMEAETQFNDEGGTFESKKFDEFILEYVKPNRKDIMRIRTLNDRAKDDEHLLRLATNMANAIGRNMEPGSDKALKAGDKAESRGNAAEEDNFHDVASLFFDRAAELRGE